MTTFIFIWVMLMITSLIIGCVRLSFMPYISATTLQQAFLLTPTDIQMQSFGLNKIASVLLWLVWILVNPIILLLFFISLFLR